MGREWNYICLYLRHRYAFDTMIEFFLKRRTKVGRFIFESKDYRYYYYYYY